MRQRLRTWYYATRPFSFTASTTPVVVGLAMAAAEGFFDLWLALLTLLGALGIQIGTNLVDEYHDYSVGVIARAAPPPHKVIQRGLLSHKAVRRGAIISFSVSVAMGLYLIARAGLPILLIGLFSVLAGYLYTAGPRPLGYLALGEAIVFVFMGPVAVMGTYYVQTGRFAWPPLWAAIPVGLLVAAILEANNIRDIPEDTASGKRTFATLFGRRWANRQFVATVFSSYIVLGAAVLGGSAPALTLLAVATLPTATAATQPVLTMAEGRSLNVTLQQTAKLHHLFGLLLAAGYFFNSFLPVPS